MTRKINKLEKPGRPQGNFHALFGRSPIFYGHFRVDVVMSEWSIRISSSYDIQNTQRNYFLFTAEGFAMSKPSISSKVFKLLKIVKHFLIFQELFSIFLMISEYNMQAKWNCIFSHHYFQH